MADEVIVASLRGLGLVGAEEAVRLSPLTGGVSSDIHLVETADRRFCIKRALARLKVAAVWEAPLGRNAAEADWMQEVGAWLPHAVPKVLGRDEALGLFAMEFLPPERNPVWKAELLAGRADSTFAGRVGADLATIHSRSARKPDIAARFANDATFVPIRIEPYLSATGKVHPDLAARFEAIAHVTLANKKALVHGDVSPKNILCGGQGPVFLDAECACHGDPAFDLAFCLNHLLLKGVRTGFARETYRPSCVALVQAYRTGIDWEEPSELEQRTAALLPALLLARVDGKSPVEYLTTDEERDAVRRFAIPRVASPPSDLLSIVDAWIHP